MSSTLIPVQKRHCHGAFISFRLLRFFSPVTDTCMFSRTFITLLKWLLHLLVFVFCIFFVCVSKTAISNSLLWRVSLFNFSPFLFSSSDDSQYTSIFILDVNENPYRSWALCIPSLNYRFIFYTNILCFIDLLVVMVLSFCFYAIFSLVLHHYLYFFSCRNLNG